MMGWLMAPDCDQSGSRLVNVQEEFRHMRGTQRRVKCTGEVVYENGVTNVGLSLRKRMHGVCRSLAALDLRAVNGMGIDRREGGDILTKKFGGNN